MFTLGTMAGTAQAYCPMYTCQDVTEEQAANDDQVEPHTCRTTDRCITEGYQLFWPSKCLTYGVSELNTSVFGLSGDQFDAIIGDAFAIWQGVDCGGGKHPGFQVQGVGVVDSNGMFTCERELRANLAVWSLVTRWTRQANALAFTFTSYDTKSGEIFDADVDLHLAKLVNDVAPGDYAAVLGNVALHEAGHYLGLAHSFYPNAAMEEGYGPAELVSHALTQDDIDGICELFPPDEDFDCSKAGYVEAALEAEACEEAGLAATDVPPADGGCMMARVPSMATGWLWALAWIGAFAVRRARWLEPGPRRSIERT